MKQFVRKVRDVARQQTHAVLAVAGRHPADLPLQEGGMTELQLAFESYWDHAAVSYPGPQRQADRAWETLKTALTKDQQETILSARGHCFMDSCSREEFDDEMLKLGKSLGFR